MQLSRRARAAAATAIACAGAVAGGGVARADDHVTIRGAYYREPSTRVIQPVVEIGKDLPDGFDVSAHYLVDAITSASAAAGTAVDSIFTELRNEVGIGVGKTWDRTRATLSYKYSAESDYWSHALSGSLARGFWGNTATVALMLGGNLDALSARGRTPACATPPSTSCSLDGGFGGVSYTQVLSPVAVTQLDVESAYLSGFQGNLYRTVPNFGYEVVPSRRLRTAISARVAYYLPRSETGFQLQYRFYWDAYVGNAGTGTDPWALRAHTAEARLYQKLSRDLEVRLSYRQYLQNHAEFWCDAIANPGCYPTSAVYYSTDPKLGPVSTEYPEVKLIWDAVALRDVPFFRWFSAGTFEISYGRYFQNTSYGDAHVLQTGYTMPY